MSSGNLAAVLEALGDQLTELAGSRFTRLTALVAAGAATFPVESTFGWPSSGKFFADGVLYSYAGLTATTLTGVTWRDPYGPAKGRISAVSEAVTLDVFKFAGVVRVKRSGVFVGTLTVETSPDGAVWTPGASYTGVGESDVAVGGTPRYLRLRASAWTSGAAGASLQLVSRTGAKQAHRPATVALDYSRQFNVLEQLRRQFFVDTATGKDLSTVARNLGVRRPPALPDDDAFRKVVKVLAYAPKGSMQAIELALAAFFGAGNFRVWENFPAYRNTVFIQLLNNIHLADDAIGQAYLSHTETLPLDIDTSTVTLSAAPLMIEGIRLAPDAKLTDFSVQKPSVETEERWPGAAPTAVWQYDGTTEGSNVLVSASEGGVTRLLNPSNGQFARYHHKTRVITQSDVYVEINLRPVALASTTDGRQFRFGFGSMLSGVMLGMKKNGSTNVDLGFINDAGAFIGGVIASIPTTRYSCLALRLVGGLVTGRIILEVDGVPVYATDAAPVAVWSLTTKHVVEFGTTNTAPYGAEYRVKHVAYDVVSTVDYWNVQADSDVSFNSADPTLVVDNFNVAFTDPIDVGKALRTTSVDVPQNRGEWVIDTIPNDGTARVIGPRRQLAFVQSATTSRISVENQPAPFRFPDDVNKFIELFGSNAANQGARKIVQVIDPVTGAPFNAGDTGTGSVVVVDGVVNFVTESGMDWRLRANFIDDVTGGYEMSEAGTLTGAVAALRFMDFEFIAGGKIAVEVTASVVRSAQLLQSQNIANAELSPGNFAYYPFYLPSDPLGPFAEFLDDLTVAGVIPEVIL